MPCTICQHPKRRDIDQALIAGSTTLAALSKEYGLSTSALHRHKAHLQANLSRVQDQLQNNLRQGCLFWLSRALEMAMQTAAAAQAEGNSKLLLQAILQGTRLIGIILKEDFQPDPVTLYEILASPQWATQPDLLPQDPQILAAGRRALVGTLFSTCPDTPAAPSSPDPQKKLDFFQEYLLNQIHQADQPQTDHRKLQTENRPGKKREKGGKLPGKTPFRKENDQEKQEDNLWKKIAGMIGLPGTMNPKFETMFQGANSGQRPENKTLSEYMYEQSLKDNQ